MQGGFQNPPVGNQGVIERPVFKSDNYVAGVSGWAIYRNGNVEFNSGTFRGTVTAGTFQGTDFVINQDGAFFYSGVPALGNLIVAIAPAGGTDSFGNAYNQGITILGPGANRMTLDPGFPEFSLNPNTSKYITGWGRLYAADNGAHGSLILEAPINSSGAPGYSRLTMAGQDSGGGRGAFIQFDTLGTPAGLVQSSIPIIKTNETWIPVVTFGANWSASATFNTIGAQALQYRADAEDNTWLIGCFTAAAGAANPVFTLPVGYRPSKQWNIPCYRNNGGAVTAGMCFISTTGNVDMFAGLNMAIAAGNEYYVNGKIPIGNIA